MISADELRDARIRAGYTSQAALAAALDVSERTIANWEAEGGRVSVRSEAKVRSLLWPAPGPLSSYSSYELLSELGRRLDMTQRMVRQAEDAPTEDNDPDTTAEGYGVRSRVPHDTTAEGRDEGSTTTRAGSARIKGRGPRIKK